MYIANLSIIHYRELMNSELEGLECTVYIPCVLLQRLECGVEKSVLPLGQNVIAHFATVESALQAVHDLNWERVDDNTVEVCTPRGYSDRAVGTELDLEFRNILQVVIASKLEH